MFWKCIFVFLQCYSVAVFCFIRPEKPCKLDDVPCLTKYGQEVFKIVMNGDPKLELPSLDPLSEKVIEGEVADVKFTLTDSIVTGFKQYQVKKLRVPVPDTMIISFRFPHYELCGQYAIDGKFLDLPIHGKGLITLTATDVDVELVCKKEVYEKNGKKYFRVKSFETKTKLMGTMHMDAKNLFDGKEEQADKLLKALNENGKDVIELWSAPITKAHMTKVIESCNKIFDSMAIEEMVVMANH